MVLLTETVLLHWNFLELSRQSQNTAREDSTRVEDWADKLASALHSPCGVTSSRASKIVDSEPDQVCLTRIVIIILNIIKSLCPPPSKRARTCARQRLGSGAHNKYVSFDLPRGATTNNVWQRVFIPTLAHLSSTHGDPWEGFPDDILLETLQQIWDTVYEDSIPHSVVIGGPVYSIVCPCHLSGIHYL